MNRKVLILRNILEKPEITQRELCRKCGTALGTVNGEIRRLLEEGYLRTLPDGQKEVTAEGLSFLAPFRAERAVIMAAGFGSRFVPLTLETPKGLLPVFGEPMIERQIRQLHEAGITDISVIVGYMKEAFEYLTDKYGVKLIYNPEFTTKNTLASLYHAREALAGSNTYILSSDNWMRENLYHTYEPCAWYAAAHTDGPTAEWVLETDKNGRIRDTYPGGCDCDYMYGPAYFTKEFSKAFLPVLARYYEMPGTENYYWEHVLMEMLNGRAKKRLLGFFGKIEAERAIAPEIYINRQEDGIIYEFENLEELRAFDPRYENDSGSKAMQLVSTVLGVPESEITKIRCLKAGMTNQSWLFSVKGLSYICRIPGRGTEKLISRQEEKSVYDAVTSLNITEEIVYFDAESGYKISRYYENSRNADAKNAEDMRQCMTLLRSLHEAGIRVPHSFDLGERLLYYEDLILEASGQPEDGLSAAVPFRDYPEMRKRASALLTRLSEQNRPRTLCHIDSVSDNFIFTEEDGAKCLRLIDWEYAGMADPLLDVAMCAIYSFYSEEEALALAGYYFGREPSAEERDIIFAYMALGGLLWSLWGVYKEKLGVQFTDYTIRMYRYFKEYSKKVIPDF